MTDVGLMKALAILSGGMVATALAYRGHPIGAFATLMVTFMSAGL